MGGGCRSLAPRYGGCPAGINKCVWVGVGGWGWVCDVYLYVCVCDVCGMRYVELDLPLGAHLDSWRDLH